MTGSAKRKGDKAEREAAAILHGELGIECRRKLGAGRLDDCGDLDLPGEPLVVQVADWTEALRAVREKPIAAEVQRANAKADFAVSMIRLKGGVWRMVMTPQQFATLYREATA